MSNRPVTSREYKLILKTERFNNRITGTEDMMTLVARLINNQGGTTEINIEEKKRWVMYLDTPTLALRQNGFVLRLREEIDAPYKYKLTLKYRHPDRYLASRAKVKANIKGNVETKFEEDIIRRSVSRFALSTSIELQDLPNLKTLVDSISIFPGLKTIPIPKKTKLIRVSGFKGHEIKLETGKFYLGKKSKIKPCLSFWYLSKEAAGYPLVAEFSFDYDVTDDESEKLTKDSKRLEHFPASVVKKTNAFFNELQGFGGWFDLAGSTKTAFAYSL